MKAQMEATLAADQLEGSSWDVLVVGAGPAGALAARQVALSGLKVLLVEKSSFPRSKVCGCCLSETALGVLESVGLETLAVGLGAEPLNRFRLACGGRSAQVPLPGGRALSREALDAVLVEEAIVAGVQFLPKTLAKLLAVQDGFRGVSLEPEHKEPLQVTARMVLAADGLGGNFLREESLSDSVASPSRIGAGTVLPGGPAFYTPGTIFMACAQAGYVGLVRLEQGQLDVAAALDPEAVREAGGPGKLVTQILESSGFDEIRALYEAHWVGTPALTRKRQAAGHRLFLLGDSAGYVEPFTGEGIAWALGQAVAVVPLVLEGVCAWDEELVVRWEQVREQLVGSRQGTCRWIARFLRHPARVKAAIRCLAPWPGLASPLIRALNKPFYLQPQPSGARG